MPSTSTASNGHPTQHALYAPPTTSGFSLQSISTPSPCSHLHQEKSIALSLSPQIIFVSFPHKWNRNKDSLQCVVSIRALRFNPIFVYLRLFVIVRSIPLYDCKGTGNFLGVMEMFPVLSGVLVTWRSRHYGASAQMPSVGLTCPNRWPHRPASPASAFLTGPSPQGTGLPAHLPCRRLP